MAARKRFGMYKDEEKKVVRVPQVANDQVLVQLIEAWLKVKWKGEFSEETDFSQSYKACLKAIEGIQYTSKEVEKISIVLARFQDKSQFTWKAGLFLSALINNCPESDFLIHTQHMDERINGLGIYNTKNIVIEGDAGDYLAEHMSNGTITVRGNAGSAAGAVMKSGEIIINGNCANQLGFAMKGGKITLMQKAGSYVGGRMENGEIVINGNCGDKLGDDMLGGKITVKGNAGDYLGINMEGGEIRIEGEYGHLCNIQGGKIYHRGMLIDPKEGQR